MEERMINELQILINGVKEAREKHDKDYEQLCFEHYIACKRFTERVLGKEIKVTNDWKVDIVF